MWEEELMWEVTVEFGGGKWKWEVESRKVLGVMKVELR